MVELKKVSLSGDSQHEAYGTTPWEALGWEGLEDGLTTSRRAVVAPAPDVENLGPESPPPRRAITA